MKMPKISLPSGGKLDLDPGVAEVFLQHAAVMAAPEGSRAERDAEWRRDYLLEHLDARQLGLMHVVCHAVERLRGRRLALLERNGTGAGAAPNRLWRAWMARQRGLLIMAGGALRRLASPKSSASRSNRTASPTA